MNSAESFAIYCETANTTSSKKMESGSNLRVFNKTKINRGNDISLSEDGTTISLTRGCFHITAMSIVSYVDELDMEDGITKSLTVSICEKSNGGYCAIFEKGTIIEAPSDAEKAIAVGTVSHTSTAPSFIDTILNVEDMIHIQLIHQAGNVDNKNVFLTVSDGESVNRIFSQITIIKMN
ncbi:hypothetical protein BTA51_14665 [Hahella sp. CCB-MM4]|uniref:hypothetical protein n=1 Tax=Hahella sp. (strain CCB-MM4) TaxID=1926491 RepID=UPI000B9A33D8|nr:hypothetical protein [Hahella sp. CCB-MM4]OZG72762.1 hypothetical protein BTA51_14665 [Hahella sp. CCB-MM4]